MPIYEVQFKGKTYEVDAPNMEMAAGAFDSPDSLPVSDPAKAAVSPAPAAPSYSPYPGVSVTPASGGPVGDTSLGATAERLAEPVLRAGEGLAQLGLEATRPFDGSKTYHDTTQGIDQRRKEFNAKYPETSSVANDLIAGAVPVGGVVKALPKATTWLGATLKAGIAGGAAGAAQYTPEGESKGTQIAVGAALPGAVNAALGARRALANVVTRFVQKAEAESPRITNAIEAAKEFFSGSGAVPEPKPYSVGQASGDPVLDRLEKRAYGPKQQELRAAQADEARARFDELANNAAATARVTSEAPAIANAINDALNTQIRGMKAANRQAFQRGLQDVATEAGPHGGTVAVPLDNLKREYAAIASQDANPFSFYGSTLPKGVKSLLENLNSIKAVKVPTLQTIMSGLGQDAPHGASVLALSPEAARAEQYRTRLFAALNRDIDSAGVDASTNPAFAQLRAVRDDYARRSAAVRDVEQTALTKLFGDESNLSEPQAALDKFYSMRAADQKASVDLLARNHPELLAAMRANRIKTAITDATNAGNAKNSSFSVQAFNESLFGRDAAKSPLWGNDAYGAKIRAGAAHLKVLLNSADGGPGSIIGPEDVAINAFSLTKGFIARLVTRAAYGRYGDQLLGTPAGLAALRTLANTTTRNGTGVAQAVAYITTLAEPDANSGSQITTQ